ncbi:hypothetical protein NDU88_005067 [Pleurodeles waltl]|uniref:Uncharacterized protein n=1 Tax=Pleurodeles waltl TaxID=8319 RepID=A0AAV7TUK0_PLEWA|nr:hypothetical protein NDU88_005067 [Pleurodeles waltl]
MGISDLFIVERAHPVQTRKPIPGPPLRPNVAKILNYRDLDQFLWVARERAPLIVESIQVSLFQEYSLAVQHGHTSFMEVKNLLNTAGQTHAQIVPAKLKAIHEQCFHFFDILEAVQTVLDHNIQDSQKQGRWRSPPLGPAPTTSVAEELQRLTHSLHHPFDKPGKSKGSPAFGSGTTD